MQNFDCFNGDADGITALIQLRLANPQSNQLVTGVKRDIALLDRVDAKEGSKLTVLDISMEKNTVALERILDRGAEVFYCDHHRAGNIPQHPRLHSIINTNADVCTSILISGYLRNAYSEWAIVGAYGDNLSRTAENMAAISSINAEQIATLKELGTLMNYNAYGNDVDDLLIHPADLYQAALPYATPLEFLAAEKALTTKLRQGFDSDMQHAGEIEPSYKDKHATVYILPDATWARRVSGTFSNALANRAPTMAHAVLTRLPSAAFVVSVRAPLADKQGADKICSQFATGGGRAAAAGINRLQQGDVDDFISIFSQYYAK